MSATLSDVIRIIGAVAMFGLGARMVIWPRDYREQGIQNNEHAIAERLARGHDRYFEELRTLRAYSQPRPVRTIRIFGTGIMLLAGATIFLFFVKG